MITTILNVIAGLCIITVIIVYTVSISIKISNEDFKHRDMALKEINQTIQLLIKNQEEFSKLLNKNITNNEQKN